MRKISQKMLEECSKTEITPVPPNIFIFGLNGGMNSLKCKVNKLKLIDYDLHSILQNYKVCPTDRLRKLDDIRMHNPLPDEVKLLNITPYRINLHALQEVLFLCGGLVGVRFTSEDLTTLSKLTKNLASHWDQLESAYNQLSSADKKLPLESEGFSANNTFRDASDKYITLLVDLQLIIKSKQQSIDPNTRNDLPKLDADPESKMGRKMPLWLATLIEKYEQYILNSGSALSTLAIKPSKKIKVGELSVYLSGFMVANGNMRANNAEESEALSILVQASNDTSFSLSNSDIMTQSAAVLSHSACGKKDRKYWATRFYAFLSKMTELNSAIKDESALEAV